MVDGMNVSYHDMCYNQRLCGQIVMNKRKLVNNVLFQEICVLLADISAKATVAVLTMLYQDKKIHPYPFAIITALCYCVVLGCMIRGIYYSGELQNKLVKEQKQAHSSLSPQQKLQYSIIAMSVFQFIYVLLHVLSPLLYEYGHVGLQSYISMNVIAFIFGMMPLSILTAGSVMYSRDIIGVEVSTIDKFTQTSDMESGPMNSI